MLNLTTLKHIGISETYKTQPNNPVEFLAKWLINHNLGGVREDQQKDLEQKSKQKREEYQQVAKELAKEQEVIEKAQVEKEKKVEGFHKKFQESDDLEDHLQDLSDFLSVSFLKIMRLFRNQLRLPLATLENLQSPEKKLMMKLMIKLMLMRRLQNT